MSMRRNRIYKRMYAVSLEGVGMIAGTMAYSRNGDARAPYGSLLLCPHRESPMAEMFRKKPVVIEAVQWTGENGHEVQSFLGGEFAALGWVKGQYVEIGTLEGLMVASKGDWIIRGVKGELYPIKDDIFRETYEAVDAS